MWMKYFATFQKQGTKCQQKMYVSRHNRHNLSWNILIKVKQCTSKIDALHKEAEGKDSGA